MTEAQVRLAKDSVQSVERAAALLRALGEACLLYTSDAADE